MKPKRIKKNLTLGFPLSNGCIFIYHMKCYLPSTDFLFVGTDFYLQTHHEIITIFMNGENTSLWSIILFYSTARAIFQGWTPNTYALHCIDELHMELTTVVSKTCFVASFEIKHNHFICPKLFINPFMTSSWIAINYEAVWINSNKTRPTLITTSFQEPFATRF
jgi:hypothetical protein